MLIVPPNLFQKFTVLDVFDPDELGDNSRVSNRLPNYNNFNTYRLRDRGMTQDRPQGLLSRLAVRREGALIFGSVQSRFGTDIGIVGAGVPRLFLTFSLDGAIAMHSGSGQAAVSEGTRGLIYRALAGTRLLATDSAHRITIQIDEARLMQALESMLEDACPEFPHFEPEVDWTAPSLVPITRLVQHLLQELSDPDGLFSLAPAVETFSDALAYAVLARLPHSLSERLRAPRSPAIPRQLRRAEAFMEAHAREAISIADIAAAAGCGTRALQLAFRQFRDTTPLAALHETRLLAVRAAARNSDLPASVIAREFGFSNASRFRAAFRRRFGEGPPER